MKLAFEDFEYLGRCLEGFSYGLYSGIFAMYLQYHASEIDTGNKTKNILFYALCVLYVLSVAVIAIDVASYLTGNVLPSTSCYLRASSFAISGSCNFISQSIIIYRCWIVWGRNICVVIIPSLIAIIFFAICLSIPGLSVIMRDRVIILDWSYMMTLTSLAMSMSVNLMVTLLIVFRIFKVFREVKTASEKQNLGATGGSKLQYIIFVLIESSMTVFSIQLALLVTTICRTDAALSAWLFTSGIQQMLNGIAPTFILVRVSMGLSFHDEQSLEEVTSSLCFVPDSPNPIPETGSISNVPHDSESRESDTGIQLSNDSDIQIVER